MSPIRPILFSLSLMAAATRLLADDKPEQEKKPAPKFTISKETTYVTGPLDKNGYIDYETALNERMSKGVTAENNANVLIWKALGPRYQNNMMPPAYFRRMGMEPPPDKGDYFVGVWEYAKAHEPADSDPFKGPKTPNPYEALQNAYTHPWLSKAHPLITGWLTANEKPLAQVVKATRRPMYYSPILSIPKEKEPPSLLGAAGAIVSRSMQGNRDLGHALLARAMLRIGEEKFDESWEDILAAHRLGRLCARGGTALETLFGSANDQLASKACLLYLERAKLDSKRILAHLQELQRLPPLPPLADKVDLAERFIYLDTVQFTRRGGIGVVELLGGEGFWAERLRGDHPKERTPEQMKVMEMIDWEPALRKGNGWHDRMAAALRIKERTARAKALNEIDKDLKALKKQIPELAKTAKLMLSKEPAIKSASSAVGDLLVDTLLPGIPFLQNSQDRADQANRNVQVAFALAAYRTDNGRYPPKPYDLAPKYLSKIPDDLFSGKPLIYRPDEKGYLLYSVGVNGKDEGGRQFDDDPPGDDLAVRMPLPERKKKE